MISGFCNPPTKEFIGLFGSSQEGVANRFQIQLIPSSSYYVRQAMHQAESWSKDKNFFVCRGIPVLFAISAVALSAINIPRYLLSAPLTIPLNIVQLRPVHLVVDFLGNIIDGLRSLVFVALGVTLVVLGLIMPQTIFYCFAPEFSGSELEWLKKKCGEKDQTIEQKDNVIEKIQKQNQALAAKICELEDQIKKKGFWSFPFFSGLRGSKKTA